MTDNKNVASQGVAKSTNFFITEAYKTIRTNLQFAISTSEDNVSIITSYEPNAGKSITAANIAITMGQTGARVLLIDADMRNASQHRVFNIPNNDGLSRLLSGFSKPEDAIFRKNIRPNLDLLTAGPIPPNPSELLGSKNMGKLLETLRKVYDYIFIDCPPVGVVSDALSLLAHTKNVTMVVRQKQTRHDDIRRTTESVKSLDGKMLGVIITDVAEEKSLFGAKAGRYGRYGRYDRYGRYAEYASSSVSKQSDDGEADDSDK